MDLARGSFRIGRLAGITIYIHFLFLLFVAFWVYRAGADWQSALIQILVIFGIVLAHEFGHCFGARAVGGDAEQIVLWPLGGLAYAHTPARPWPRFVMLACGPLVNVALCAASASLLIAFMGLDDTLTLINPLSDEGVHFEHDWLWYVYVFYYFNAWLFGFNMLPIYPLDGGQILQTILWPFMGARKSTIVACYIGLGGAVWLGIMGLNEGGMLLMIAIFGGLTCFQQLQAAKAGMLLDDSFITPVNRRRRSAGGWLTGLFSRKPAAPTENPNPGGWERTLSEREQLENEVDRILQKVKERGIQSLSYVERQTLERATRARQAADDEFDRQTRL